ncbi:MAG TPA: hypothetical protein VGH74_10485 [Planctomycetaceae bacterium]
MHVKQNTQDLAFIGSAPLENYGPHIGPRFYRGGKMAGKLVQSLVSAWRGLLSLRDPAALTGRRGHPC